MSKIEERHDEEFAQALNAGNLSELLNEYDNLLKTTPHADKEKLDILWKKVKNEANLILKRHDNKIESNYQRKLRYHHVGSINYKVGFMKSNEFGDFLTSKALNPEEALMNKEIQAEQQMKLPIALNALKPIDFVIYTTYKELGFYPTHENWKKLSETLLIKGFKKSDKSCKLHFEKTLELLQSLVK
jgi:hypothetical protein